MFTPEYVACTTALEHFENAPGEKVYIATPIMAVGSYPSPIHAKMLVLRDNQCGTIGGGNIEYSVIQYIQTDLYHREEKPEAMLFKYSMRAETIASAGMACGGQVTVLIRLVDQAYCEELKRCLDCQGWVEEGTWMEMLNLKDLDEHSFIRVDQLLGYAHSFRKEKIKKALEFHDNKITRQILGAPTVHIFGGGHVGRCVAEVSRIGGFRVNLYEDREYLLHGLDQQITIVRMNLEDPEALEAVFKDNICNLEKQFVVIVTRGHKCDGAVIRALFKQETMPTYVGMIGSLTKIGKTWTQMRKEFDNADEKIAKVKAPIGLLEVGGDQPGQIAVAIVGQMIQILTNGQKRYV